MRRFQLSFFMLFITSLVSAQRVCNSDMYLRQLVMADPSIKQSVQQQQSFIQNRIEARKLRSGVSGAINTLPVIRIPVVVHVLYNSLSDNLSDAQILSQLTVLNQDFRKKNVDINKVPERFTSLSADCVVEFYLATRDPQGGSSNGIVRKKTNIQFFGLDDRIKKSAHGGDDPWDTEHYLNIWTGNLAGGVLGYSSPVGGPTTTDGVVVRATAFGTTGNVRSPFHRGRTATHEIGHWLGLQHIWGDRYCGDDQVDDTPSQQSATQGCPSGELISCNNTGSMYMNYLDLTNDECMQLFTIGQRQRMRVLFEEGGARFKILSSDGLGNPTKDAPDQQQIILSADLKMFPNPSNGRITLLDVTGNTFQNRTFRIVNQFGQALKLFRFIGTQVELNLASMPSGVYLLETTDRKFTRRFVKS